MARIDLQPFLDAIEAEVQRVNRMAWIGNVIDGELADDTPRALPAQAEAPVRIVCDTHLDCDLRQRGCVQRMMPAEQPDTRTWTERATTFRVVDHRRAGRRA